jgi:ABC-type antimicrobial peptide transport system permease subunit
MMWVNRKLADEIFGPVDLEPVGQQINLAGGTRRIMGVVENIPEDARGGMSRKVYIPHAQYSDNRNWALIQTVKARGNLTDLRESIVGELSAMDPQLVLYRPQSFEGVLGTVRAQDRFATVLMGAFAFLALVLSVVGTYGVLTGTVEGRTREIGIRKALGAKDGSLRWMVLGHAAWLTLPGIGLGLVGAWIASRWIEALLFDVEAVDPMAYGLAVVVFLAVGLFSGWLPAVRATRVEAVRALVSD